MRSIWTSIGALVVLVVVLVTGILGYEDALQKNKPEPDEMEPLVVDQNDLTVNTTRIGSDDPIQTAVAVAQIIYPVTEEENSPGAVILINRTNLAEAMVAASRVQHFPVNAPLLWVDENSIPAMTRNELLRLKPEGVPMDENNQVYLVGTIGDVVEREVRSLGFRVRRLQADNPIDLAEVADNWSSTQHTDHKNAIAIANLDHLEPAIPSMFWNAHMGDGLAFVTDQGIPEATRRILQRRAHGPWIYVFGDSSIVSNEIVQELGAYGQVTRIPGSTPTEISAYFAGFHDEGQDWGAWFWQQSRSFGWGISEAGHNAIFVNLTGPGGWQNAVTATTLSHMGKHAPVLILEGADGVPQPVASYLKATKPYPAAARQQLLNHGWIIGGEQTISWQTQAALDVALDAYIHPEQKAAGLLSGSSHAKGSHP
jgi:hypothetical protein